MKRWQKLAAGGASAAIISAAIVAGWEGKVNRAHFDPYAKIWDICYGHTKNVKSGDIATDAQCDLYLQQDMATASADVSRCIHVPLKDNERAAFESAAYNLGSSIVCGSTLQRLANSGDITGACLQLTDALDSRGNNVGWVHAGGQIVSGLRNRRVDERNACIGYFK